MLSTIKKTLAAIPSSGSGVGQANTSPLLRPETVIKIDSTGFAEFPNPDDISKQLLPHLIDPEEELAQKRDDKDVSFDDGHDSALLDKDFAGNDFKNYWMPDRLCKVCYSCEEPFTMFRRRHHCRMCGQVFCNPCSSYYLEGTLISLQGLVRCCKLCFEQMERELKSAKKKNFPGLDQSSPHMNPHQTINPENERKSIAQEITTLFLRGGNKPLEAAKVFITESPIEKLEHSNVLQNRASSHLEATMKLLVKQSFLNTDGNLWESTIISLIREVVSSVDPNVKEGDSIDIRNYVKLKIIPGGTMAESTFIDGVVFKKTVSHKKMMHDKNDFNPRILLLSGGIDFQRMDTKLSSMDTLIEQEDKYMEILVEKIMSLKPDLILVGKSVARCAQELFCKYKVVVMQNVKQNLLERVSRMTGAKVLQSTDHMFQQSGLDCLGTCGKFTLRIIQDDPEKMDQQKSQRILRTRIARGTTYCYLEGCPSEKGCTIVLRGGDRSILNEVKSIINFGILIAYHLRLEVAYYTDRYATFLPVNDLGNDKKFYDTYDESDDEYLDIPDDATSHSLHVPRRLSIFNHSNHLDLKAQENRMLLSTSLDVDLSLPYATEIRGIKRLGGIKPTITRGSSVDHQLICVTSILMHDSSQKSKAEKKILKYYTAQDLSLGQFLIENCFNIQRNSSKESSILDQTLCFIHRPGRIEITVNQTHSPSSVDMETIINQSISSRYISTPIYMSSFCRECNQTVTPENFMSDETWKMSFGKFLEISFYNRNARCRVGKCNHHLRDDHTLIFTTEFYTAKFVFIPIHPYSLFVRHQIEFMPKFHLQQAYKILTQLPQQYSNIVENFRKNLYLLVNEVKEVFNGRLANTEDFLNIMSDLTAIDNELQSGLNALNKLLGPTLNTIPKNLLDTSFDTGNASSTNVNVITTLRRGLKPVFECVNEDFSDQHESSESSYPDRSLESSESLKSPMQIVSTKTSLVKSVKSEYDDVDIRLKFPMYHRRQVYLQLTSWNSRISAIAKSLELIRESNSQQPFASTSAITHASNPSMISTINPSVLHSDYSSVMADVIDGSLQLPLASSPDTTMRPDLQASTTAFAANDAAMESQEMIGVTIVEGKSDVEVEAKAEIVTVDVDRTSDKASHEKISSSEDSTPSEPIALARNDETVSEQVIPVAAAVQAVPMPSNPSMLSPIGQESRKQVGFDIDKVTSVTRELTFAIPQIIKPPETKSVTKPTLSISKAFERIFKGKDAYDEEEKKYLVNIGELGVGRLSMSIGRKGEVIPVCDDEVATIIAYSLASVEYYDLLQEYMREDYEDLDSEEDFDRSPPRSKTVMKNNDKGTAINGTNEIQADDEDEDEDGEDQDDVDDIDSDEDEVDTDDQEEKNGFDAVNEKNAEDKSAENANNPDQSDYSSKSNENSSNAINTPIISPRTPKKRSRRNFRIRTNAVSKALANASSSNNVSALEDSNFTIFTPESMFDMNNLHLSSSGRRRSVTDESLPQPSRAISDSDVPTIDNAGIIDQSADSLSPSTTQNPAESSTYLDSSIKSISPGNTNTMPTITTSNPSTTPSNHPANAPSTGPANTANDSGPHGFHPSDQSSNHVKMDENRRHMLEKQLLSQRKSHIKHRFEDHDEKGNITCKFQCQTYWATQFEAVRAVYLNEDDNEHYIRSLAMTKSWLVKGGKSGATFSKTMDDRFVVKAINRVEMQMFLDFAPAYFEYLVKAFFHNLPTVLCKIMGVYTVGYHNRETGKKVLENIVVMENIFYQRNITGIFDLKGSSRARYLEVAGEKALSFDDAIIRRRHARRYGYPAPPRNFPTNQVLLDDNLMELTKGRPFPLKHRAKVYFTKAVTNDTLFLKMVDVVDYSIIVGFDEDTHEVVVGIIDYLRKYDIVKKMERMGKSVGMLTGQAEPTIIQPPQYRNRFQAAMDRYFMPVPDAWIAYDN